MSFFNRTKTLFDKIYFKELKYDESIVASHFLEVCLEHGINSVEFNSNSGTNITFNNNVVFRCFGSFDKEWAYMGVFTKNDKTLYDYTYLQPNLSVLNKLISFV